MGRPRRSFIEAREFGLEVERERKPYDKLETVFEKLHRRYPRRWKSKRTMYRLWGEFQADQRRRAWLAHRIKELTEIRQRADRGGSFLLDGAIEMGAWWLDLTNDPRKLANWLDESKRRRPH
jgi:hypothetical protein